MQSRQIYGGKVSKFCAWRTGIGQRLAAGPPWVLEEMCYVSPFLSLVNLAIRTVLESKQASNHTVTN